MKRRTRGWLMGAGTAALLGYTAWVYFARPSAASDIAAIKRMGFPTTYAERDATRPYEGNNAAHFYGDADQYLAGGPDRAIRQKAASALVIAAVYRKRLDTHRMRWAASVVKPSADMVRKGSELPACAFPEYGIEGNYHTRSDGTMDNLRGVVNQLQYVSRVNGENGEIRGAFSDLGRLMNISRQLSNAIDFQGQAFSGYFYCHFIGDVPRWVDKKPNDRATVLAGVTILQTEMPIVSVRRMVAAHVPSKFESLAYGIEHRPSLLERALDAKASPQNVLLSDQSLKAASAQIIHRYRKVIEMLPEDPYDWKGAQKVLARDRLGIQPWPAKEFTGAQWEFQTDTDGDWNLFVNLPPTVAAQIAAQRVARQCAAILLYRLDHGSPPDALPLKGDDALDPFSDGSLIYKHKGTSFMVYSVGMNGVDNQGDNYDDGMINVDGMDLAERSRDIVLKFK
jgi:hypothetical protein